MFVEIIGYLAGLLLAACFVPQVIKTWRTKSAEDVSIAMLSMNLGSAILYEVYAWHLGLMPVVVMNGIFLVLVVVEIGLKVKYERNGKAGQIVENDALGMD